MQRLPNCWASPAQLHSPPGFELAGARHRAGLDSYLGLLDAQRALYAAEQDLIESRQADAGNRVTVYKVLGGGGV